MRFGQAALEAGGRVDVNAEHAPVDLRYKHCYECAQRGFNGRRFAINRTIKHRQSGEDWVNGPTAVQAQFAAIAPPLIGEEQADIPETVPGGVSI